MLSNITGIHVSLNMDIAEDGENVILYITVSRLSLLSNVSVSEGKNYISI